MRSSVILASVGVASASAILPQAVPILPRETPESYDFSLWAITHSHNRGYLRTLSDGQLRLGDGSIPIANLTFTPGRGIVDSQGRGCITTPGPTNQVQCDEGVKPMSDLELSCGGMLQFKGSPIFWACAVNDDGVQNVYTEPVPNQLKCVYITLFSKTTVIGDWPGCHKVGATTSWLFPWDKFYNNSDAAHPGTPKGDRQMASYLKDSLNAPSNATVDRPKPKHDIQSPDGRCGAPTGFNCFGKTDGPCCSPHGWCGFSAGHCGAGCQGDFGICDDGSSGKAPNRTLIPSKVPSKASSTNSTSSTAPSKTSAAGKASSGASHSGKASSSSGSASTKASATSAPKHGTASPNGQCGTVEGYHCNGFAAGSCCGSSGWCGSSPGHCGSGCQSGFGTCGNGSSSTTASAMPKPSENATSPTYLPKPLSSDSFSAHGCPHDLEGTFESPRLMVTVDKAHPDKALNNRFDGTIGEERCTLYNFDVSPRNAGQKCSLVWLFPDEEHLEGSTYFYSDSNSSAVMEFWHVRQPAKDGLTWNKVGPRKIVAAGPVRPGFSCNAKTVPCTAGFEHSFMVCGQNFRLKYAQDPKPPNPMGLYIRTC